MMKIITNGQSPVPKATEIHLKSQKENIEGVLQEKRSVPTDGAKTRAIPFASTLRTIAKDVEKMPPVKNNETGKAEYLATPAIMNGPRAIIHLTGAGNRIALLTARTWEHMTLFNSNGVVHKPSKHRIMHSLSIGIKKGTKDEKREVAEAIWEAASVAYVKIHDIAERDTLNETEEAALYQTFFSNVNTELRLNDGRLRGAMCEVREVHRAIDRAVNTLCERYLYKNVSIVPRAATLAGQREIQKVVGRWREIKLDERLSAARAETLFQNLSMQQQLVYFALAKITAEIHDNKCNRVETKGGYFIVSAGKIRKGPPLYTYLHRYESSSGGELYVSRDYLMGLLGVTAQSSKELTKKGKDLDTNILALAESRKCGLIHGAEAGKLRLTDSSTLFSVTAIDRNGRGENKVCEIEAEGKSVQRLGRNLSPFYRFTQLHPELLPVDKTDQYDSVSMEALRTIATAPHVNEAKKTIRFNMAREIMFATSNDRYKATERPLLNFIEDGATEADFRAVETALSATWGTVSIDAKTGTLTSAVKQLRVDRGTQTAQYISLEAAELENTQVTAQKKIGQQIATQRKGKK